MEWGITGGSLRDWSERPASSALQYFEQQWIGTLALSMRAPLLQNPPAQAHTN
jgi:hypothetical protein|tara:strand:- start:316 stop:474 length:159 start_codon:yes stop_codon:yes gene_type:complete